MSNKSTKSKPPSPKRRSAEHCSAASRKWNVLITGDLMTGKTVLARRLMRSLKLERPLLATSIIVEEAWAIPAQYLRQFEREHELCIFTGLQMSEVDRFRLLNIRIHQHIHLVSLDRHEIKKQTPPQA